MAVGKTNKHWWRLYADEFDLSGDAREVGNFGLEHEQDDASGWRDGVVNFTMGRARLLLEGFRAVFNRQPSLADGGSFEVLKAREAYVISLLMGIRAAPAAGDPAFCAPMQRKSFVVDGEGPVFVSAEFSGGGQGAGLAVPRQVFGRVMMPKSLLQASVDGPAVDWGAATLDGGKAYLHVLASDGGAWAFRVQHSTDGNTWADLGVFTLNGASVGRQMIGLAGVINRYTRFTAARTGGTVTVVCSLVRE